MAFYKRSIFIISPAFQWKFSLIIGSLIFFSSLIYPLIFIDFINELMATNPVAGSPIIKAKNELLIFLAPIQILFTLIVLILSIFLTHKIAGPLHKLKEHLISIREGEKITPLHFRKGDYFHDVAEEVTLFLDTVVTNQENDFQYLDEVSSYLENLATVIPDDKKPVLNEISRRLLDIQSRYKKSL